VQIDALHLDYTDLNEKVRECTDKDIILNNVIGQRYIGSGNSGHTITINGVPGNALGCYLNGSEIVVNGNGQDATGDTMNKGRITICGNCGDATGYAMRGGKILIKGNTGYRCGIHMKAYKDLQPTIIIGQKAGDFLGEYQAGGLLIVLGLGCDNTLPMGPFCGTGMHGGKIIIRTDQPIVDIPKQVMVNKASEEDMELIAPHITDFCKTFGVNESDVYNKSFYVLTPNSKNPYKQLYTHN
jgi:glutamate synthase domain-containing protein 3